MYRLAKKFRFEAAHKLTYHDGKCARLHGHSWRGMVIVTGPNLVAVGPKRGMLIDYGDLSKLLHPLIEDCLDHRYLNDTLDTEDPTSEFVAWWLYSKLVAKLPDGVKLESVIIEETCTSSAEYRP
jgi:6-pyruvoyltetrahydropterin/6-carboxytetrahydropterin synthase